MVIECVTLETNHLFQGNPITEQHKLRYAAITQRQQWNVPYYNGMEYDQYDTPAASYVIWRDKNGKARGVSRLSPTTVPFMLQDSFSHMVTYQDMPTGPDVWEGSRFCIDHTLSADIRLRIAQEIVISYLEYGLLNDVRQIIGIMYPVYWNNLFTKNGWTPVWIGDPIVTPDGKKSRAAILPLSTETLQKVRKTTGILQSIISLGHGTQQGDTYVRAA